MQITDLEHQRREKWRDPASFNPAWGDRAKLAAQFIEPGSSVLDVGCGALMALRDLLPGGCTYTGADLEQWSPEIVPVDLDAGEFPAGPFDVVAMLGVFEYLRYPTAVLTAAHNCSDRLVVSFTHPTVFATRSQRETKGWVNHFSRGQFRDALHAAGWTISEEASGARRTRHSTVIYSCRSDQK